MNKKSIEIEIKSTKNAEEIKDQLFNSIKEEEKRIGIEAMQSRIDLFILEWAQKNNMVLDSVDNGYILTDI